MPVPEFKMYNPSKIYMDKNQLKFYQKVKSSLESSTYIDVNGNISYIFVYLYDLLNKWNKIGYENLAEHLIYISEIYVKEKKLSEYCLTWAYDCLLGQRKYSEFLDKTECVGLKSGIHHDANLRLNIQYNLGLDADAVDILMLSGEVRRSQFVSSNPALYKEKVIEVFTGFAEENKAWFSMIESRDKNRVSYPRWLFIGTAVEGMPKLDFEICSLYSGLDAALIRRLAKDAENLAREEIGVPLVGEGWVSETELYRKLAAEFSVTKVLQHGRPSWLGRQHFDIWMPNWMVAVEYHGKQHFEPVEFFGGIDALEKNIERDKRKERLAKENGVELIVVTEGYDLGELIKNIYSISNMRYRAELKSEPDNYMKDLNN